MTFLPIDYEAPKTSGLYMRLQEGENKIRILTNAIVGWEDWQDKKPIRYRMNNKPKNAFDPNKPIKHFWAFIVWNYNENKIQILQITQASVRKAIEALCRDADWGAPWFYDIKIIRSGKDKDTEYVVNPIPHRILSENIREAFKTLPCNLDALFDNTDPFASTWANYTPGMFDSVSVTSSKVVAKPQEDKPKQKISIDQANEFADALTWCSEKFLQGMWKKLEDKYQIKQINDITIDIYPMLLSLAKNDSQGIQEKIA